MQETLQSLIQSIGFGLEVIGVFVIVAGYIVATATAGYRYLHTGGKRLRGHELYRDYRQALARSILIGLEFLVAGDIMRTVSGDLTLVGVATLGGIVLIRIVLGWTLESEINPETRAMFRAQRS